MPDVLDLDIGNVTYSGYDDAGYLAVQFDAYGSLDVGESDAGCAPYQSHHPLGFLSRPLDPVLVSGGGGQPDPTRSCLVLTMQEGGVGHALPLEDTRVMPLLPSLKKGESMQYGPLWGQFVRCRADGSLVLSTTTKSITDGTGQQVTLTLSADGSLQFVSPYIRIIAGSSGFHVYHTASGASLDLGSMSGLPAPLDSLGSMFSVQAGFASIDSTAVATGPSGGISGGPPALATPLVQLLTQIVGAMAAISAALPPGPAAPTAAAAMTTLTAALPISLATIPSTSTSA